MLPPPPGFPRPKQQLKKSLDHWEKLEVNAKLLKEISNFTLTIKDSLNMDEVGQARKDLAIATADAFVLLSLTRKSLSIMDGEWKELMSEREDIIRSRYEQNQLLT